MLWLAAGAAVLVAVLLVLATSLYASREISRIPFFAMARTPRDLGWEFEDVSFASRDGLRLTGWFVPAPRPSEAAIIVLHGFGANAGEMIQPAACLRDPGGWNLFFFNFRGHGGSEGLWTTLGALEQQDLDGALDYLRKAHPQECRRIALFGHSLGAAVALVGAARHPEIAAVAAESPFASIRETIGRFARMFYGIPFFPFIPLALAITSLRLRTRVGAFAPVREIGRIAPRPLLLIHSERDLRMPRADADRLWQAAGEPKELWTVAGADHGEAWLVARSEFERKLVEFFRKGFA